MPFTGKLTIWQVDEAARQLTFLREYDPGFKVQFATFHNDWLLVYGSDRLQILDTQFRLLREITDPWLAGGHTVFVDQEGFVWLTAAPANALLRVDLHKGEVVERLRLPEIYGRGYQLGAGEDTRRHFIPTDLQPTHVNCAVPTEIGLLVTLCIQGAVGVFDEQRCYREIVRGFRGCHGARYDERNEIVYLTDSPAGLIWFVDPVAGAIAGRYKFDTAWLHDADQVADHLFVAGLSDHNRLQLVDTLNSELLCDIDCTPFGASVMFVNVCEAGDAWGKSLVSVVQSGANIEEQQTQLGPELLPGMLHEKQWERFVTPEVCLRLGLTSKEDLRYEYLIATRDISIEKGIFVLSSDITCRQGGVMIGVLDVKADNWIASYNHDSLNRKRRLVFELPKRRRCRVIVTANNPNVTSKIDAEIRSLSLRPILPTSEVS